MDYASAAVWSTSYKNNLPDSAFLYVESGGKKDSEGKTVPRTLRHFPYKDSNGKIDIIHLRNAIARIPVSDIPKGLKKSLQDKARKILKERNKKSKSNLLVATLNKIVSQNISIASTAKDDITFINYMPVQENNGPYDPCCEALNFADKDNSSVQNIVNFFNESQKPNSPYRDKTNFKKRYLDLLVSVLDMFFTDYCECQNSETTSPCYTQLNDKLNAHRTMNSWIMDNIRGSSEPMGVNERILRSLLSAFTAFFDTAFDINATDVNNQYDDIRTDNLRNFLDDICKIHSGNMMQALHYGLILTGVNANNVVLMRSIEEVYNSVLEISEAPQVSGEICLPVVDPETEAGLNQYGISPGSLAACVIGAGFFGGAVGIRAYCRMNKAGKAAAIATCAAAAASQTGSAAVNANDPAVRSIINDYLYKLCEQDGEGGLFQCEESTQGGGDEGGGPVDPPGGGEVGEIGGGIL